MCHASQASGSAPGSASAHLFGAPGSASELLPVDAASVAEGGSGLAPSSSSGRHHCGIWHINDHATKDKSTAQALYDAIPMIAPTETQYVRCLDAEKGQYRLVSKIAYMALPQWNWTDVLTFSDA
jgi:hypothetical protein